MLLVAGGLLDEVLGYLRHHLRLAGPQHMAHASRCVGFRRVTLLQLVR